MAEEYDYFFKTIVIGDGGVGKTALTTRFTRGFFGEEDGMTVGVDFHVKMISINSNEGPIRAKLQIWDTADQEHFSSIRPMYYRGSLGALLMFDLTNSSSFAHLPQWIEEVRWNVNNEIPLLLVGNKCDLVDQRAISLEDLNSFTQEFNLYYVETSAKTGESVGYCFYALASLMMGSDLPDSFISKSTIFKPGQIFHIEHETPIDDDYAVHSGQRCENCKHLFFEPCPEIDGEAFKLCPNCFNFISGKVREIENIFNDNN